MQDRTKKIIDQFEKCEGHIMVKLKGYPYLNRVVIYVLDGLFYEEKVLAIELEGARASLTSDGSWVINYTVSKKTLYENYYQIPWSHGKPVSDLDVNINISEYEPLDDVSIKSMSLAINFGGSSLIVPVEANIVRGYQDEEKLTLYILMFCACVFAKLTSTWRLVDYTNQRANRKKFSFYTMMGIFLWDCILFKGFIIPVHSTLPVFQRVILSTGFFVALFFELVLLFIIIISTTISADKEEIMHSRDPLALTVRILVLILLSLIIDPHSTSIYLILGLYLSPQIYKNYHSLNIFDQITEFIGYNATFFLLIYFKVFEYSIGYIQKNFELAFVLITMVAVQWLILFLQTKYVSSFFSPKIFEPLLSYYKFEQDLEKQSAKLDDSCSICLSSLRDIPLKRSKIHNKLKILASKISHGNGHVIRTPCEHQFHTICLSEWIETKPDCPMCRKKLEMLL